MRTRPGFRTIADVNGGGQIDVSPSSGDWVINAATTSSSSATKQPTADLYRNGTTQQCRIDGTYTGAKDTVRGLGVFQSGETLTCIWTGADPGAILTLTLDVTQYDAGKAPPDTGASFSPFTNSVVGGTTLVRDAINSTNYIPGQVGWSIMANGAAEFNGGIFRGAVLIGGPPAAGAVSIGLTGSDIPAVLRNFSVDYQWFEADVRWISLTQFFFTGLVKHIPTNTMETVTGLFTNTFGVQLQSLVEGSSANTWNWGSGIYDTSPLAMTWRNSVLDVDATCTFTVDGDMTIGGASPARGELASFHGGVAVGFTNTEVAIDTLTVTLVAGRKYHAHINFNSGGSTAGDLAQFRLRHRAGSSIGTITTATQDHMSTMKLIQANTGQPFAVCVPLSGIAAGQTTFATTAVRSAGSGSWQVDGTADGTDRTFTIVDQG